MPAQSDWADISAQVNREAEYNGSLKDLLKGVADQIDDAFVLLEDEELDEDTSAEVWSALDNLSVEIGFLINRLT